MHLGLPCIEKLTYKKLTLTVFTTGLLFYLLRYVGSDSLGPPLSHDSDDSHEDENVWFFLSTAASQTPFPDEFTSSSPSHTASPPPTSSPPHTASPHPTSSSPHTASPPTYERGSEAYPTSVEHHIGHDIAHDIAHDMGHDIVHNVTTPRAVNLTVFDAESPDVRSSLPDQYLAEYKSFCWYSDHAQFLCLPSVYIAGFPKCGTTDLYSKLIWHPQFLRPSHSKEYFYWSRSRLGRKKAFVMPGPDRRETFTDFAASFGGEALILGEGNTEGRLVDGSQNLMWDQMGWKTRYPGFQLPPYTYADVISTITPGAKVIVMVRDPVERLYSEYLFLNFVRQRKLHVKTRVSRDTFRDEVEVGVAKFNQCYHDNTLHLQYCCYEQAEGAILRIYIGVYFCHLVPWYETFKDNLMVVFLDEYSADPVTTLLSVYKFAGATPPNEDQLRKFVTESRVANTRETHGGDRAHDMYSDTRALLRDFYRPFNRKLAEYFDDRRYLFYDNM